MITSLIISILRRKIVHILNGMAKDPEAECVLMRKLSKMQEVIDLFLGGIGPEVILL